ncbi:MAG: hypothetical protein JRG88_09975 [Deltaproteobacteria bacterium]|nr:hypothetical protein [Deltaproteobacteria bacterium]
MEKMEFNILFITPAFLGNAEQQGQWRTPPFKALLREWWRIAMARTHNFDHEQLREAEGRLFGHAWLKYAEKGQEKTWAMKGQVLLRLSNWRKGQMRQMPSPDPLVFHQEVGEKGRKVGSHLYLGYGPLIHQKGTTLKSPAIDARDWVGLILGLPNNHKVEMENVFQIIHYFGTIGGRCRNGWGSVYIENTDKEASVLNSIDALLSGGAAFELMKFSRPLEHCLQLDWPHALGKSADGRLLIWKSKKSFQNWSQAMQELARVKIAFRTILPVPVGHVGDRHILAYPVTNHKVKDWLENGKDANRLANQIRFKVVQDNNNRYWPLAYHLPCGLPQMLQDKLKQNKISPIRQKEIWMKVHKILDKEMHRISQGGKS